MPVTGAAVRGPSPRPPVPPQEFAPPVSEPDAVVAMRSRLRERVEQQSKAEGATKEQLAGQAKEFLESYYKKRAATRESRIQEHRRAHDLLERQVRGQGPGENLNPKAERERGVKSSGQSQR